MICKKPLLNYHGCLKHIRICHKDAEAEKNLKILTKEEYEISKKAYDEANPPYCKICDIKFAHLSGVYCHIAQTHGKDFSGEFVCGICDGQFLTEFHLRNRDQKIKLRFSTRI